MDMLKNYLKTAFRNLKKHQGYSSINIFGLAVGIFSCLLILLYVRDEFSYDDFHSKRDRIYRLLAEGGRKGEIEFEACNTSFPLGPALQRNFPEVLQAVRFREGFKAVVSDGEKHSKEERFYFVDANVFKVFDFPLLKGDPATALQQPNTILITESMSRKYFDTADPIGQVLSYHGWGGELQFTVTGILQDLPHNTHFNFDFLAALQTIDTSDFSWTWFTSLWTYLLLPEDYPAKDLEAKFPGFIASLLPARDKIEAESTIEMTLEPLSGIHLRSRLDNQMKPTDDIDKAMLFLAIAIFILLIACMNFINLSTARSLQRAREVGLRKTLGAHRAALIKQFLGESFLFTTLGLIMAMALLEFSLPYLNAFTGKEITVNYFDGWFYLSCLASIEVLVGLLAGFYPALILSRYQPARVLTGSGTASGSGGGLRKTLVVVQFAISALLILGTSVVYRQMQFIRSKHLGANVDQVIVVPYNEEVEPILQELVKHPGIINASKSSRVPVNIDSWDTRPILVEGFDQTIQMESYSIDPNFAATYGIELLAGEGLSPGDGDSTTFLINKAAVDFFGWGSPREAIGKRIGWQNGYRWGHVAGVVQDFHMVSFHESINPLVMVQMPEPFWYNFISIRISPGRTAEALSLIESTWKRFSPTGGYEYFFADDSFARLHREDQRFGQVFAIFAGISIAIACLGLFGLAAFAAEQRTKEIGVRKVLGASARQIAILLMRDFVLLVLAGFAIAVPVAWQTMTQWLNSFAYRVDFGGLSLAIAMGTIVFIAVMTVSFQSLRAAHLNPVDALKHE